MSDYRMQFFRDCINYTGDVAGKSVLVVGCGPGADCQPFAEAGATVRGMDISEDIGKGFAHPKVSYVIGSIEGCSLPPAFDLVFCIATLEHVPHIELAYPEMVRLAKPGGLVYSVAAPLWNSRVGHHLPCFEPFPWIHLRNSKSELLQFALDNGMTNSGLPPDKDHLEDTVTAIDYIFSRGLNRLPASSYLKASSAVRVSELIRDALWEEDAAHLTPDLLAELELKGLTRTELLSVSHGFVARR